MRNKARKKVGKRNLTGIWIFLMCFFFMELLFYTWSRLQCYHIGCEVQKAANRNQILITRQNNLKIELARLKSPQRIEQIAKQQMGLTTPKREQVVVIP